MERRDALPERRRAPSVDEILATLVASDVLETLEIADDDLQRVRSDSDLLETLTITYELLMTFDDSGVLDTFFRLPKGAQANFLRWIGATDDEEVGGRRAQTFVSALQAAPLGEPRPAPSREVRDHRAQEP